MMDYDTAEMILEQLADYELGDEEASRAAELLRLLKALDWDGMERLI